jgi:heparin/heparan-sulfate lyase
MPLLEARAARPSRSRPSGLGSIALLALALGAPAAAVRAPAWAAAPLPGDANLDGGTDLADAVRILEFLLLGTEEEFCRQNADVNGDADVDLSDPVYLLDFLFTGGERPRPSGITTPCAPPADPVGDDDPAAEPVPEAPPRATVLSPLSAVIEWETQRPSATRVDFGRDASSLSGTVSDPRLRHSHRALLTGLAPDTLYYYRAASTTASGEITGQAVLSFRTLEDVVVEVTPGRPRLFLDAAALEEVRRRISADGYYEDRWRSMVSWCSGEHGRTDADILAETNFLFYVRSFAFVGLVGDLDRYKKRAIELARAIARSKVELSERDATESLAYVYDWLHDEMDDDTRDLVQRALARGCEEMDDDTRDHESLLGAHSIRLQRPLALGGIALWGDHPDAGRFVQNAADRFHRGYLATQRYFAGTDGGSSEGWWYLSYNLQFTLAFLATMGSATGRSWLAPEMGWYERLLEWYLYGLRGDSTFFAQGDAHVFDDLTHREGLYALLAVRESGSPQAQWLGQRVREDGELWAPYAFFDILWSDPSVRAAPPDWPTSRLFRNVGVAVIRDSWDEDAAMASFRCEQLYTLGHTHRDNCSFTIFYKGDLALDSGIYDDFGESHHRNYHQRTIAHNTITVFDPDEVFTLYGVDYANDGGQRWLRKDIDVPSSWPASIEAALDPANGFLAGGVIRYEHEDEYTYVVGDGTPSYSPHKLAKFHRHFLWLDEVAGWGYPVVLVLDDVIATRSGYAKAYLLHTENEPAVSGNLVSAENGEGMLYQHTLEPRDARITKIGGPGREFWVNGRNYPPDRPAEGNEQAGSWRIEVSPGAPRRADVFLHALYPADEGTPAPLEPETFQTAHLQGCRVGQWTVLFDIDEPEDIVLYPSPEPESSHLVLGMLPGARYEISLDGARVAATVASAAGTVRFGLARAGTLELRRLP